MRVSSSSRVNVDLGLGAIHRVPTTQGVEPGSAMRLQDLYEHGSGRYAAQAYWNALAKLRAAWKEVFAEDLPTEGNRAMGAFEQAIDLMKARLATDATGGDRLRQVLDVDRKDDIAEVLLGWADMDDVAPKIVRQAMIARCLELGKGRHDLRSVLRPVLDVVFADSKARRPRVGANRHWPRLLQYLRELEDETDASPAGQGLRLLNAGGGGRVARHPSDPGTLAVRVDPEHLL